MQRSCSERGVAARGLVKAIACACSMATGLAACGGPSSVDGSSVDGSSVDGSSVDGSSVDGSSVGPDVDGQSVAEGALGSSRAALEVDCQQLGPDVVGHSCLHAEAGPFAQVTAEVGADFLAATPNVNELHTYYAVDLSAARSAGAATAAIKYRPLRTGDWAIFASAPAELEVVAPDGTVLPPLLSHEDTGCSLLPWVTVRALEALVTYTVRVAVVDESAPGPLGLVIEHLPDFLPVMIPDRDGDGVGSAALASEFRGTPCAPPPGWVFYGSGEQGIDCDDGDATRYPGAPELCDGLDHDCDGLVDTGCAASAVAPAGEEAAPAPDGTPLPEAAIGVSSTDADLATQPEVAAESSGRGVTGPGPVPPGVSAAELPVRPDAEEAREVIAVRDPGCAVAPGAAGLARHGAAGSKSWGALTLVGLGALAWRRRAREAAATRRARSRRGVLLAALALRCGDQAEPPLGARVAPAAPMADGASRGAPSQSAPAGRGLRRAAPARAVESEPAQAAPLAPALAEPAPPASEGAGQDVLDLGLDAGTAEAHSDAGVDAGSLSPVTDAEPAPGPGGAVDAGTVHGAVQATPEPGADLAEQGQGLAAPDPAQTGGQSLGGAVGASADADAGSAPIAGADAGSPPEDVPPPAALAACVPACAPGLLCEQAACVPAVARYSAGHADIELRLVEGDHGPSLGAALRASGLPQAIVGGAPAPDGTTFPLTRVAIVVPGTFVRPDPDFGFFEALCVPGGASVALLPQSNTLGQPFVGLQVAAPAGVLLQNRMTLRLVATRGPMPASHFALYKSGAPPVVHMSTCDGIGGDAAGAGLSSGAAGPATLVDRLALPLGHDHFNLTFSGPPGPWEVDFEVSAVLTAGAELRHPFTVRFEVL